MPRLGKRLTDAVVRQLPHGKQRYDRSDGGSGLIVRVEAKPSRQKTWQLRYRTPGGQQRRMTLGAYPELSLHQARAKVAEIQDAVARGDDPAVGTDRSRFGSITVGDFIDLYVQRHFPNLSDKTAADYRRYLDRDVRPAWRNRKLKSITRADVANLIDAISQRAQKSGGSGVAGTMLRRVLSKMFSCAVAWGYLDTNPVTGTTPPAKVARRAIRLAVDAGDGGRDIQGSIGRFLYELGVQVARPETVRAIQLCLLLGLRVHEAVSLERKHVHLSTGYLYIQGKGAKERRLPLVGVAAKVIADQIETLGEPQQTSPWVFPQRANPQKHISESSVSHAVSRAACAAGMLELTTHDLRRTCATGLRSLGTDRDVVALILGHAQSDVTAAYVHATLETQQRVALSQWGDLVERSQMGKVKVA